MQGSWCPEPFLGGAVGGTSGIAGGGARFRQSKIIIITLKYCMEHTFTKILLFLCSSK